MILVCLFVRFFKPWSSNRLEIKCRAFSLAAQDIICQKPSFLHQLTQIMTTDCLFIVCCVHQIVLNVKTSDELIRLFHEFRNYESMIFFHETEFVCLFLCTVKSVSNKVCRFIVPKYLWNHLMSRSKNFKLFTSCTELVNVLYWTRNQKWTICRNFWITWLLRASDKE